MMGLRIDPVNFQKLTPHAVLQVLLFVLMMLVNPKLVMRNLGAEGSDMIGSQFNALASYCNLPQIPKVLMDPSLYF